MTFRVQRKKLGLTYSCPTDADDNPIPDKESLLEFLETLGEIDEYIVAEELHENGKRHYHAYVKYCEKLNTRDPNFADSFGNHPNILNPGKGWPAYCRKHGAYITNMEESVWHELRKKRTWAEAEEMLIQREPQQYYKYADAIERNWKKSRPQEERGAIFYGPWPKLELPTDRCLVLTGRPGTGKTQWAKYLARHAGEPWCYLKGALDKGKRIYKPGMTVIYDDITPYEKWTVNDWCSLFDTNEGGQVNLRHAPLELDAGLRILCMNDDLTWPEHAKLQRRLHIVRTDSIL